MNVLVGMFVISLNCLYCIQLQLELAMAKCELEKEEELERQELQQLQEMKDMRKELQCCQDLVEECSTLTQSCRVQKQELLKLQVLLYP